MKKTLSLILALTLVLSLISVTGISAEEYYEDASSWTITASCNQKGYGVDKAFDGNIKTYWHSEYSDGSVSTKHDPPHTITVEFPDKREISGVTYVPRQKTEKDSSEAGIWQIVEVYTSEDGVNYTYNTKFVYETVEVAQKRETATAALYAGGSFKAIRFKVSGVSGHGSAAEIKFIKQECKRMIKENFSEAFDWLAQTIATEDFQNTVKEHNCKESGAFELYVSTESAGVPVTGVTFYILATIGLLFGIGVEINGAVKRVEYTNFFDSMDELASRLAEDSYREEIVETIFKQIDMADDDEFQINP